MNPGKVIDISDFLAIKEIASLLDLPKDQAKLFFYSLKGGKTLAEALREIDIKSASQISLEIWPDLRSWRDRNFPESKKISIPTESI